jgi:murein DD-endopeptidase MepM/ murein hydrolase activator NlpD
MDNLFFNSIMPLADQISATSSAESASSPAEKSSSPDFRQLLTIMLLSSLASQGSSSSDSGGMGMSQLMAPLMLSLLEKMLSEQIETVEPIKEKPKTEKTPVDSPKGMPIKGTLTQGSHPGHIALDFGAPVGTPVKATMDGKVVYAGWNNEGYGNLIIVENGPYRTYFAHLSKIPVKIGDKVTAGMVVGYSGNTGNSTGPHLHYEVRKNGQQINPTSFTLS